MCVELKCNDVWPGDNFQGSFLLQGSPDQTQAVRFDNKLVYPWSHLVVPVICSYSQVSNTYNLDNLNPLEEETVNTE